MIKFTSYAYLCDILIDSTTVYVSTPLMCISSPFDQWRKQQTKQKTEFISSNKWQFNWENILISFPVFVWCISLFFKGSDLAVTWFRYLAVTINLWPKGNKRKEISAPPAHRQYNYQIRFDSCSVFANESRSSDCGIFNIFLNE